MLNLSVCFQLFHRVNWRFFFRKTQTVESVVCSVRGHGPVTQRQDADRRRGSASGTALRSLRQCTTCHGHVVLGKHDVT